MKKLILLLSLLFVVSAEAVSFRCETKGHPFNDYMTADAMVQGEFRQTEFRTYLERYDIKYDIMIDDIEFSRFESRGIKPLKNRRNYNPTVYRNHFRFDFSHLIPLGKGSLMFPFEVFDPAVKEFRAALMLSQLEHHAGGTLRLNCVKR